MDFRMYDNALGRFYGMDALSEKNHYLSPFQFGNGNPVFWADPTGLDAFKFESYNGNDEYISNTEMDFNHLLGKGGGFDVFSPGGGGGGGGAAAGGGDPIDVYNFMVNKMQQLGVSKIQYSVNNNGSVTFSYWKTFAIVETFVEDGITYTAAGGLSKKMTETVFLGNDDTPWMTKAKSQLGVKEITGNNDGKDVEKYLKTVGLGPGKSSYWCGAFVNWTLKEVNIKTVNQPAWALNWRKYGTSLSKPAFGAIATKKRGSGGHVGFVAGITSSGGIVLLGGNQSDSVNYTVYSAGTVFQYNFPSGYTPNYNLPTLNITGGGIKEN
jgi:uncharacterized protein (TIGR02594 family)